MAEQYHRGSRLQRTRASAIVTLVAGLLQYSPYRRATNGKKMATVSTAAVPSDVSHLDLSDN